MISYRGYTIHFDTLAGWLWVHDDFDGAPDAHDNRHGMGKSIEDCKEWIDEMEDER